MATIEEVVAKYRELRDHKKELEDKHKEELAPTKEKMVRLENWLQQHLLATGSQSIKTESGTVYQSRVASVKVEDWTDAVLPHIIENELWHVLENRLAKASIEEYVEAQGHNFPGTSIQYTNKVNIRK